MDKIKLSLNVYDDEDNVVKTSEGQLIDIKFGTLRALMKLLKVDDINDTAELLKVVYSAWDKLVTILEKCFPDMEVEDWDNVRLADLIPILLLIVKYSAVKMSEIPTEKNVKAE